MNWETVSAGIGHSAYALWNNGRKLLSLAFNSESNTARVECGGEKRLFYLKYEGFLRNKVVLRNEYGIRIGQVLVENKEKMIELNDQKLFYQITEEQEPKLIIYKDSENSPLAVCALTIKNEKSLLPSVRPTAAQHSLLLTLTWFLFSPVAKDQVHAFA